MLSSATSKIKELQTQENLLGNEMAKLSPYVMPVYQGLDKKEKTKQYYETKEKYNKVKKQRNELQDKISKIKQKTRNQKKTKFINSDREATPRIITSETYKRQQKRQARELMIFIGGK